MKHLIIAVVSAFTLVASAAWEKVGSLQLAGAEGLAETASRLGTLAGNPMIGMALAAQAANPPFADFFGPMREKGSLLLTLFVDGEAVAKSPESIGAGVEYAVLYPVTQTKAEFLKAHAKTAVETNGFVRVLERQDFDDDIDDAEDYGDEATYNYVIFSDDGRWAAMSDKAEQARLALGDVTTAEKPLDGDLLKLRIGARGIKALDSFCAALVRADTNVVSKACSASMTNLLKGVTGAVVGMRLGESGLDVRGAVKTDKGSVFAKVGDYPLGAKPFKFASPSAIWAKTISRGVGSDVTYGEVWAAYAKVLHEFGFDLSALGVRDEAGTLRFEIDSKRLAKELTGNATNALAKVVADSSRFSAQLEEAAAELNTKWFAIPGKASNFEFSIKGRKPKVTAAERFAKTLPEVKSKPLVLAEVCSFTALAYEALTAYVPTLSPVEQAMMKPIIQQLPAESETGFASAVWAEGGSIRFMSRLSVDELKSASAVISAVLMRSFAAGMNAGTAEFRSRGCNAWAASTGEDH